MTDIDFIISIDTDAFNELDADKAPLLEMFHGRNGAEPGRAYLRLTEDGVCELTIRAPWDNTTPADEWHGVTNVWELPAAVRGGALHALLTSGEVLQLLQRVYEGHEVDWDGRNDVGSLDEDAEEASAELQELFEGLHDDCWTVWDAQEYLAEVNLADVWPAGNTLAQAVQAIQAGGYDQGDYCDAAELQSALLDMLEEAVEDDEDFEPTQEQRKELALR